MRGATVGHVFAGRGHGYGSIEDLRGQRVSVGAPGSGTEISAQMILAANGITYDDFDPQRLNFNETADAIRDGDIVAGFWSVGPPTSSIMNLAATRDISVIGFTEAEITEAVRPLRDHVATLEAEVAGLRARLAATASSA